MGLSDIVYYQAAVEQVCPASGCPTTAFTNLEQVTHLEGRTGVKSDKVGHRRDFTAKVSKRRFLEKNDMRA